MQRLKQTLFVGTLAILSAGCPEGTQAPPPSQPVTVASPKSVSRALTNRSDITGYGPLELRKPVDNQILQEIDGVIFEGVVNGKDKLKFDGTPVRLKILASKYNHIELIMLEAQIPPDEVLEVGALLREMLLETYESSIVSLDLWHESKGGILDLIDSQGD